MLALPPLAAAGTSAPNPGEASWRLPLSEAGARDLVVALCCDTPDERHTHFRELLAVEPNLTLWAVLRGPFSGETPFALEEIARWFSDHGARALRWARNEEIRGATPQTDSRWAELAAAGCWVAKRAVRRAGDSSSKEAAAGLLHNAHQWLSACGPEIAPNGPLPERIPAWLREWMFAADSDAAFPPGSTVLDDIRALRRGTARVPVQSQRQMKRRWRSSGDARWESVLPSLTVRMCRLAELEDAFQQSVERAKLDAMRGLAYGASHEINNPLANISSRAQTLLRRESDPERRRTLAKIDSQALRAHEMIADMMLFAKPPTMEPDWIEFPSDLQTALADVQLLAEGQGTSLRFQGEPLRLCADREALGVAIKALIKNALEALGADGYVTVSAEATHDEAGRKCGEIVVSDTGPGIAPAVRPHLFDPFYSGREAGRGLGLGLSKCWRIVTAHGGTIAVSEDASGGARFTIRLPVEGEPSCTIMAG